MHLIRRNLIYRRMMVAGAISTLGDSIYYVALMTYASLLPDSTRAIMWVSLSETLPSVLHIFFGVLADQTRGKVRRIGVTYVHRMICYGIIAFLMGFTPSQGLVGMIALLNFISDLWGKYSSSLYLPFSVRVVENAELEQASGLMSAVQRVCGIIAQLAGSVLVLWLSFQALAVFNSITFALGGLIFYTFSSRLRCIEATDMPLPAGRITPSLFAGQLRQSLLQLYRNKPVWRLAVQITFINMSLFPLSALFGMYAARTEALVIQDFALTVALFSCSGSVGIIAGNVLAARWFRNWPIPLVLLWNYLFIAGFGAGLLTGHIGLVLGTNMLACACVGIVSPKYSALITRNVQKEHLSSISGAIGTLGSVGGPLANALAGGAAAQFSLSAGTGVLLGLVITGLLLLTVSRSKNAGTGSGKSTGKAAAAE